MAHRVRGATDLKRADRLQILELEIDLTRCVGDVQPDERRADCGVRDRSTCVVDISK